MATDDIKPEKITRHKKGRFHNKDYFFQQQALANLGFDEIPRHRGYHRDFALINREMDRLKMEAAGLDEVPSSKDHRSRDKFRLFNTVEIQPEQVTLPELKTDIVEAPRFEKRFPDFVEPLASPVAASPVADMQPDAIQSEIAELEAELATLTPQTPEVIDGQLAGFTPPQAPELPGAEILENPLLKAIQDDVQRRVFAGQASRRRIAPTETAVALQNALMPTALNLGLTQQAREQAQQQQNISNLMGLFGMGGNIAAGQGQVGTTAAGGIGSALQAGGAAQAGGALGQAQAIGGGLTSLFGQGGSFQGLFNQPVVSGGATSELGGGLFGTGLGTNFANTVA